MAYTFHDGSRLWYETVGEGPPLSLIGGFGIAQNQFDFALPFLTSHFRCLNWNYRGAGLSDWTMTRPYALEEWVDDLKAVLDAAGIEKTAIWATSTGSAIGIRFAAKYPERTSALITYPWFRCDEGWKNIFTATFHVARTFGLFTLARVFAGVILPRDILHAKPGIDFEDFETECFERNINMATFEAQMNALINVDLTGDVRRLECPTLLLMGSDSPLNDQDELSSASHDALVQSFLALKPDAKIADIPNTGSTYCMITDPEPTSARVIDYLKTLSP